MKTSFVDIILKILDEQRTLNTEEIKEKDVQKENTFEKPNTYSTLRTETILTYNFMNFQ